MEDSLIIVTVDVHYCDYLRQFDHKVPYNYGEKESRPFVGILFKVDECMYFAPLSSPKPKHLKIKSNLDFLKLDSGKLGAINFNNMIPVSKRNITELDLDKICTTKSEKNYIKLLKEQLFWLNRNNKKLYGRSKKLYDKYIDGTLDPHIAKRCCNFVLLEDKCKEYECEIEHLKTL